AEAIMRLDEPVCEILARGDLPLIPGIGKTIAARIEAWIRDHDFSDLEEIRSKLPEGFDELLKIPGLGFKRIRTLQRERSITTIEELADAVKQGRLAGLRAFPKKFTAGLPGAIETVKSYRGKYLIDISTAFAREIRSMLISEGFRAELTGECRRTREVLEQIDLLVEGNSGDVGRIVEALGNPEIQAGGDTLTIPSSPVRPPVCIKVVSQEAFAVRLLFTSGSDAHVGELKNLAASMNIELGEQGIVKAGRPVIVENEEDIYRLLGVEYLPPEVREGRDIELARGLAHAVPHLVRHDDMKGTIHNHTTFSDGKSSLEEMVLAARDKGYLWIGISDHSRSAYYAGGLDREDVARQHREIDELGSAVSGITILKGIESDILADGSLDYPRDVLDGFDFVIASIHTQMDMDRKSMTKRIIKALRNPYTSILAHPTGRLLLAREPYAVDMEAVLEEALKCRVAVELNANPLRLDIDWRLIDSFVSRGGTVAVCPDAHTAEGLDDIEYGIMMARKGFLTPQACLNTWDVGDARRFLRKR
ncbi:MAG TPA: PHP domain-containing protein, partial [Deltaproteobacteria bacterium]|nr:PHP domain-containing protein [Deltaproteobacteria bacterium]